jgi:outer membrane protein insertion porin family
LAVTHVDPYVTPDGISRTIELFDRKSDLARLNLGSIDLEQRGGAVRFGVPFTEFDTVYFGVGYEGTQIDLTDYSPFRYIDYVNRFGNSPDAAIGTIGWARDNRDNLLVPTRGRYQRAFLEVALPVLDLEYYRATYQYQQYVPLTSRFTLAFNGEVGVAGAYGSKSYPIFKNFYAGGIGSVRGFEGGSLGPRDINGDALGGTRRLNGSIEALMPLPGADRTLRTLAFVDTGQVWGEGEKIRFGDLRAAAGFGIAWISPLGPMKISYALPLRTRSEARVQRFQCQLGTGF